VRVEAPPGTPAAAGETVAVRGVFHQSGAAGLAPGYVALDVESGRPVIRPAPHGLEKRYGMFAVSALVLAVVAWRLLRAFRATRGGFEIRKAHERCDKEPPRTPRSTERTPSMRSWRSLCEFLAPLAVLLRLPEP